MKLKEFLDKLNTMVKEDPKILNLDVIYSSNDEGNSYEPVYFAPSKGNYSEDGEYNTDTYLKINAICIN